MSYPSFEIVWQQMQEEKATKLATKYASVNEAFNAYETPDNIQLLAGVIHPGQKVLRWEKTGSSQAESTSGLPHYVEDREGYDTVGHGVVYYFHPSTLKEGDIVEYDGRQWQVLMNHLTRGSAGSLAYQCLYLLEVQQ